MDGQIERLQPFTGADPGELQQLGRRHRAGAQDDLTARARQEPLAIAREDHTAGATLLDHHALDEHTRLQCEIGAVEHRLEKTARRAPAPTVLLVDLEIGHAGIVAPVEIRRARDPRRLAGGDDGVEDFPAHARVIDPPLTPAAMMLIGAHVILVLVEKTAARHPSPSRGGRAGARYRNRRPGRACRSWR